MAPLIPAELRPATLRDKKMVIFAIMEFNESNEIMYSKTKLATHFGIHERTVRRWFSDASEQDAEPGSSGPDPKDKSSARQKQAKPMKQGEKISADPAASSTDGQRSTPKRKNPAQNGGLGRKKLKPSLSDLANQDSPTSPAPSADHPSSSLDPPEQAATPSKRKIAQPKKEVNSKRKLQRQAKQDEVEEEMEV